MFTEKEKLTFSEYDLRHEVYFLFGQVDEVCLVISSLLL